ncbi:ATP-binding protein [Streptomyces anthocyanicus]|uniref:ATP-binding protein n=1 Tax=Streptomyces anthocyanicus TaxID=68174 RepID=UPI00382C6B41
MTDATRNVVGAPSYTAELPCVRESVRRARDLVSSVLTTWGMDDALTDCGQVIVTELLANTVEHTETPLSKVTIERRSNRSIRIGVSDQSHDVPHVKTADADSESGRGLRLVAGISSQWGYDTHRWGKVTWAVIEASRTEL